MSNSGIPIIEEAGRFGKKIKEDFAPDLAKKPGADDGLGKPTNDKGPADKSIEARTAQFETRKQALGRTAAAAGATRSDNDADVLGYTAPRRRSASREILG